MKPGVQWFGVWAQLSEVERDRVRDMARLESLTISDFVRRCINLYLVDVDDDGLLLAERQERRGRPRRAA